MDQSTPTDRQPIRAPSPYDCDSEAIAWAREKIRRVIERADQFERHANDSGSLQVGARWRTAAGFMRRTLLGGQGCVIAAFDNRLPEWVRAVGGAAPVDRISVAIATLHGLIGHDKTAVVLGQEPGDLAQCLLCAYENEPTEERKLAVELAMAQRPVCGAALGSTDGRTRCELEPHGADVYHASLAPDGQRRTWSDNEASDE